MNATPPRGPDKAEALRYFRQGVVVADRNRLTIGNRLDVLAIAEARDEVEAEKLVFALNTVGRLLGDPQAPYFVAEVEALAEALAKVGNQSTLRSMQALGMGEVDTARMFGVEGRAITAGADMLRRMLAELLKFALVRDSVADQGWAWFDATWSDPGHADFPNDEVRAQLVDAYCAGMIAGQMVRAQASGSETVQ